MRFVFLLATVLIAAECTSTALLADDIYVNNVSGDDKFNGRPVTDSTANAGPVRTIGRALQLAQRGDRIIVQKTDQPYHESITVQGGRHSGTTYSPFSILSDGAILDGTSEISPEAWEHHSGNVFRFSPELKSYQQLYLDGKPADRIPSTVASLVPDLEEGQWALVDGRIYFCTAGGRVPSQYNLRYCKHQTGITLYEVNNVRIDGLVVQGFQLDGVNAHEAVENSVVSNCRLRGNGRSGLSIGGAARIRLDSSVVGANGGAQVRSEGYCSLDIRDCRLLESENTGPAIEQDGGRILVDGRAYRKATVALNDRRP